MDVEPALQAEGGPMGEPLVKSTSELEETPGEVPELESLLAQAQEAYEANDSLLVSDLCSRVLEIEPNNVQAWGLLARFGGWDSKLYQFDIDFVIDSAKHVLSLVPEGERYEEASEIYLARKRQIALMLEAAMMTPSYTGAKQLHETMKWWERILVEIPYLNSELLEGEIALCSNLCARSRIGIMPGDRLVYVAYSTLNGKETYGEMFRKSLEKRLAAEQGQRDEAWANACAHAQELCSQTREHLSAGEEQDLREVLEADKEALSNQLDAMKGLANRAVYQQQLEELEKKRAKLPVYKLFKVREADARLSDLRQKLAQIDAEIAPEISPIEDLLAELEERLSK